MVLKLSFFLSLSHDFTVESSKGYLMSDCFFDVTVNRMYTYIFLCFTFFLGLISKMVNTDTYNPHKNGFLGASVIFKNIKGVLRSKYLKTTDIYDLLYTHTQRRQIPLSCIL